MLQLQSQATQTHIRIIWKKWRSERKIDGWQGHLLVEVQKASNLHWRNLTNNVVAENDVIFSSFWTIGTWKNPPHSTAPYNFKADFGH